MSIKRYVCGFLFSSDRTRVLLIRKSRPAWQAGKLNGIGGKIEPGETPLDAMRREFKEEAALDIADWDHIVTLSGKVNGDVAEAWAGYFFRAIGPIDRATALTDEAVEVAHVDALPSAMIPNLRWIIPMCLDDDVVERKYEVSSLKFD